MIVDKIRETAEEENIPVLGFGPASGMANEQPALIQKGGDVFAWSIVISIQEIAGICDPCIC